MNPNHMNGKSAKGQSADSAATVNATDALRAVRTRSPQEALGLNSGSGLLQASLVATAITVVVLAALTAGPYLYERQYPTVKPGKVVPPEITPDTTASTPTTPQTGPDKKTPVDPKVAGKTPAPKKDILDVLGESGKKSGTPVNPLDKKDDDLLKDFKN